MKKKERKKKNKEIKVRFLFFVILFIFSIICPAKYVGRVTHKHTESSATAAFISFEPDPV